VFVFVTSGPSAKRRIVVFVFLLQDLVQRTCVGSVEELNTLKQGAPVFSGSSRLEIEPKTPGCGTRRRTR
jgi:hypothetical protein